MCASSAVVVFLAAFSTAQAVVIENGAPCLEGRPAKKPIDIQKNDWACFVFCSPPGHHSGLCRACCLDTTETSDDTAPVTEDPSIETDKNPTTQNNIESRTTREKGEDGREKSTTGRPGAEEDGATTADAGESTTSEA